MVTLEKNRRKQNLFTKKDWIGKKVKTILLSSLIVMSIVVVTTQTAKAIFPNAENEAKYQKFRTECKVELGLSENDDLSNRQMLECNKALANADPVIQTMIFELNKLTREIVSRLKATREGKCHLDERTVTVCKGLDE